MVSEISAIEVWYRPRQGGATSNAYNSFTIKDIKKWSTNLHVSDNDSHPSSNIDFLFVVEREKRTSRNVNNSLDFF
uniref:TLDc domain-containing protein n=1 Tax=Caenorhabditis tropicalis TaxID=1561998 RepID=A0A1I7TNV2_9PELO